MRVIAGTARSLPLKTPAGMDTRPTTDRIKETLFNVLQGDLRDCVFVDLFAGSGGVGIEALSRGARKAYFVDNAPSSINCVMENLLFTKMADKAVVLKQDVLAALHQIYEKEVEIELDIQDLEKYKCIITNYEERNLKLTFTLKPYESIAYIK